MSFHPQDGEQRQKQLPEKLSKHHFAYQYTKETADNKNKNSVAEVNKIGARYATKPTQKDAEYLIKAFHGFLMKYVGLLAPGMEEHRRFSKETKDFLRLFMSADDRNPGALKFSYKKVADRLPNMAIQAIMSADDLYNELVTIFLEKAQKFNPKIGGFTGYVTHHYKYAVKQRLFEIQNDPLNYQPLYDETPEEEPFYGYDVEFEDDRIRLFDGYKIQEDILVEKYIDIPLLTPSLISSPSPPFDKLWSKQERAIIVKIYVEDKSFSAAADDLGYSNAITVRNLHDEALERFRALTKNAE